MKKCAVLTKRWLVLLALITGVTAARPARAELFGLTQVGFNPFTDSLVYGYPGRFYATSSVTGAVTTYGFWLPTLPSTTPGVVSRYPLGYGNFYNVGPSPYSVAFNDPNAYIEFTGGVLDAVSYFYETGGGRSITTTDFYFGGLGWGYSVFPPIGSTGPTGPGYHDDGPISFFPPSAATPEPSGFVLLALGLAGLPVHLLRQRLSRSS